MGAVITVATVEKGSHVWVDDNVGECIPSYAPCEAMTPEGNLIITTPQNMLVLQFKSSEFFF
jgi:hypothetical protein